MTNKVIALFSRCPEVSPKYPGSKWIHYLYEYANKMGVDVMRGPEITRQMARFEGPDPKNVFVIQEELDALGHYLIDTHKCNASVLVCLESPLYAPLFYNSLGELKNKFKAQVLFGKLGTHQACFPSFDLNDDLKLTPWEERVKHTCMVVSNKNLHSEDKNELQSARYQFIDVYKKAGNFDLYGKGWPEGYGKEIPPGMKLETIKDYQWNICLENYIMPGYVTEKLIECLQAGCLPLYKGAPDRFDMIPVECFCDFKAGPEFLKSYKGQKFSYQSFARRIIEILIDQGL